MPSGRHGPMGGIPYGAAPEGGASAGAQHGASGARSVPPESFSALGMGRGCTQCVADPYGGTTEDEPLAPDRPELLRQQAGVRYTCESGGRR
jgi:hypothetical protein